MTDTVTSSSLDSLERVASLADPRDPESIK